MRVPSRSPGARQWRGQRGGAGQSGHRRGVSGQGAVPPARVHDRPGDDPQRPGAPLPNHESRSRRAGSRLRATRFRQGSGPRDGLRRAPRRRGGRAGSVFVLHRRRLPADGDPLLPSAPADEMVAGDAGRTTTRQFETVGRQQTRRGGGKALSKVLAASAGGVKPAPPAGRTRRADGPRGRPRDRRPPRPRRGRGRGSPGARRRGLGPRSKSRLPPMGATGPITASTEPGEVVWEPFGGLCPGPVGDDGTAVPQRGGPARVLRSRRSTPRRTCHLNRRARRVEKTLRTGGTTNSGSGFDRRLADSAAPEFLCEPGGQRVCPRRVGDTQPFVAVGKRFPKQRHRAVSPVRARTGTCPGTWSTTLAFRRAPANPSGNRRQALELACARRPGCGRV